MGVRRLMKKTPACRNKSSGEPGIPIVFPYDFLSLTFPTSPLLDAKNPYEAGGNLAKSQNQLMLR